MKKPSAKRKTSPEEMPTLAAFLSPETNRIGDNFLDPGRVQRAGLEREYVDLLDKIDPNADITDQSTDALDSTSGGEVVADDSKLFSEDRLEAVFERANEIASTMPVGRPRKDAPRDARQSYGLKLSSNTLKWLRNKSDQPAQLASSLLQAIAEIDGFTDDEATQAPVLEKDAP